MSDGSRKSGSTRVSPTAASSSDKTVSKSASRRPSIVITPSVPVTVTAPAQKAKKKNGDAGKNTKLLKKPANVNKKLSPRRFDDALKSTSKTPLNEKLADLRGQRELEAANKKLETLTTDASRLKKQLAAVSKENKAVKNERSLKDVEIEKLGQFWQISKNSLKDAIKQRYEVEERYERMKTAHLEEVSTDPEPQKTEERLCVSTASQTFDILTARDAKMMLRLDDSQLAELLAQLESEKLAAQADYKFAVVQVETKMKLEKAVEIRRVREEKLRDVESLSRTHNQQLLAMDEEYEKALTSANENASHVKIEMVKVTDELEQAKKQIDQLTSDAKVTNDALLHLREEKIKQDKKFKTIKAIEQANKRDEATFSDMKRRLTLLEELNEIILGEYRLLEKARNDLINAVNNKIPLAATSLLIPEQKSLDFGDRLDEARGKKPKSRK